MNIGKKEYSKFADAHAPKSHLAADTTRAFLIGGLICAVAQGLTTLWKSLGMVKEDAGLLTSVILVAVAAFLTAIGIFDNIAKVAGAGTLVPITGFANSVVSPAMEFRREGLVMGVGAKLFTLAGPVLVYGISSSIIVGLITFFLDMI